MESTSSHLLEMTGSLGTLGEVERSVNELVVHFARTRLRLCVLLGALADEQLFRDVGFRNLKQYFCANRVALPYQTAMQYAKIGSALRRHAALLEQAGYRESDGLTKLIYLDDALIRNEAASVRRQVKHASFRGFRAFALGHTPRQSYGCEDAKRQSSSIVSVRFEDDTVCVRDGCSEVDVLWTNPEAFRDAATYEFAIEKIVDVIRFAFCGNDQGLV